MTTYTRDEIMAATGCGTQIAADAVAHGYMPILIRDNGQTGDGRLALYECGEDRCRVIDTNSDALWEEAMDADTWADAMAQLDV